MSHNPYATQPPDVYSPRYIHPKRSCGCPNLLHEHGCRNRYRPGAHKNSNPGCRCEICRYAMATLKSWQRRCNCPNRPHEHGCRNRFRAGCTCDACRWADSLTRKHSRQRLQARCRALGVTYQSRRRDDYDWVNVERLIDGLPVIQPTTSEVDEAIMRLTRRGLSALAIQGKIAYPITTRRVTRARARRRARLEVAA